MKKRLSRPLGNIFLAVVAWVTVLSLSVYASAANDLTATVNVTDLGVVGDSVWSAAAGELTGSATTTSTTSGSGCNTSTTYTPASGSVTLTNNKTVEALLSFSYTVTNPGTVKINEEAVGTEGNYSTTLAAGESVTIFMESVSGKTGTTTVTFSGITLVEKGDIEVTFAVVPGVEYKVGDTEVSETVGPYTVSGANTNAYQLTPTTSHYYLVGAQWQTVGEDNVVTGSGALAPDSAGKVYPTVSCTVIPLFVKDQDQDGVAPFKVGSTGYWTWETAFSAGVGGTVILSDDYILPNTLAENGMTTAGTYVSVVDGNISYTVPKGTTFLIPRDDANTLKTKVPSYVEAAAYTTPTKYRELIMAEGASITVNGAISVAGMQRIYQTYGYNGVADGPTGYIKMESGSNITINNGAFLYAWGYVYGSGSVTVESGGTVYESFQVRDYRGGDVTSQLAGKASSWRLFPMMQYYVQNVEVPMTLKAGAIEKAVMSVYAQKTIQQPEIPFVGANSMFNISSGYVVKDYIEEEDRLKVDIHGDLAMNSWNFEIKVSLLGSVTLKIQGLCASHKP